MSTRISVSRYKDRSSVSNEKARNSRRSALFSGDRNSVLPGEEFEEFLKFYKNL